MKKIIRYSIYGFKPQYQSHHLKHIHYDLYNFNIKDFPEHLQYIIQERHNRLLPFYQKHYEDFKEGIWFFLEGYKNNLSLNHLKRKVPCWKAEIEDDAIVYEPNWEEIISLDDPLIKLGGCYLPKREIHKIHNIQKCIDNGHILHYPDSPKYLSLYYSRMQLQNFMIIQDQNVEVITSIYNKQ